MWRVELEGHGSRAFDNERAARAWFREYGRYVAGRLVVTLETSDGAGAFATCALAIEWPPGERGR